MTVVTNLFQQAQLAEAAYADFSSSTITTKQALINAKFSDAQATGRTKGRTKGVRVI